MQIAEVIKMYIQSYKQLIVWQKAVLLVKEVYLITKHFPHEELYGITSQIRRAVVSIPSNIAEGYGRSSTKEYGQFYSIAYGSALEVETQLILAKELHLAPLELFTRAEQLLKEVCSMLNVLTKRHREEKLNTKR